MRGRLAAQLDRLWRVALDCGAALGGGLRTLRWMFGPDPARPGIGVLEGNSRARAGARNAYLIRLHNLAGRRCDIRVSIHGWCGEGTDLDASFHVAWKQALGAGKSYERWIVTTWQDASAEVLDSMPAPGRSLWTREPATRDRWAVEAVVAGLDGRALDRLAIGGELLR